MEALQYFFSYARKDAAFVLRLAKELREVGINLWLDQLDILGGQHWDRAVEEALQTCQGMIAVLSPDALASNNVMDEVSYALEERKIVIPILLRSCIIPFRLRRLQYIDFAADYQTGFAQLLRALRIDQPLPPRAPAVPEETVVQDVTAPSQKTPREVPTREPLPRRAEPPEPASADPEEALMATAQRELARGRDEERRRAQSAALYREAQTALAGEDWAVATEQLQALLRLEPTHAEAQARLHEVRQQQELATWYATGQQHYDASQWQAALEAFRRVQARGGNYKDVEALMATAQRELARDEEQAQLHEAQQQQATRIQFTAYYPKEVRPETWYMLPAYAHLPEALEAVQSDSRTRLGPQARNADQGRSQATLTIARGAEIVVVPELPGCRFNPPRAGFLWLEDWHCAEFHMQATPDQPGFVLGQAVNGRVAFYVGPVLVAEVPIWTHFRAEADVSAADLPDIKVTTDPYQRIFLSYSHQDALVAQQVEQAYTVLGMQSLRDVHALRSGEEWHPALRRHIEQADIFQLYWSNNAKRSPYVEHEWRHALTQTRPSFIRPLYWEQPMPDPPPELAAIHFAYFPLDQLCTKSLVRNLTHRLIRAFWSIFERSLRLKNLFSS